MNGMRRILLCVAAAAGAAAAAVACDNAGADRVLAVRGGGIIKGVVYFDRNGNRVPDFGDTGFVGVRVRLIARGTVDTVASLLVDTGGVFRVGNLAAGSYVVSIDTTTIPGDSLLVTRIDTSPVTVTPGDSFIVRVAVSYPQVTMRAARALPVGKKVFVLGYALTAKVPPGFGIFGDSTVHFADTSAAIRGTAVRPTTVLPGDSVRILGTRGTRDGQPTLNDVAVLVLGNVTQQPQRRLSTFLAASADTGRADAALVQLDTAQILDTATVATPHGPTRRLTVSDGTGPLEVRLDSIVGFFGVVMAKDTIGARIVAKGVLVPTGTGTWRLKPRTPSDRTNP